MTAKDFTALTTQATTTLADNVTRQVSAADVRQMVIDFLDSVNEGTIPARSEQGVALPTPGNPGRLFFLLCLKQGHHYLLRHDGSGEIF